MNGMKKEKSNRSLVVMVQPSLYTKFENQCISEHRTVSEVIRELMFKYSDRWILLPNNFYNNTGNFNDKTS